ncbi:hypothetical protein OPT61_g1532 [Boeremia exigua]|uniref:Uncharacterized protein n=1 Tax=Boeremia exigua TaxID=749465 RepID=A0ACC2IPX7_9PLEO|nr:hypothetical protein OPT61_g1532 [Boeremia exigua]
MYAPDPTNSAPSKHPSGTPGNPSDNTHDSEDTSKINVPSINIAKKPTRVSWAAIRNFLKDIGTVLFLAVLLIGSAIIFVSSCFGLLPGKIPDVPNRTGNEINAATEANMGFVTVMRQDLRIWKARLIWWMARKLYTPSPSDNTDADAHGEPFPVPSWVMSLYMSSVDRFKSLAVIGQGF